MSAIDPKEIYKGSGIWAHETKKLFISGPGVTGYYGHKYPDVRYKYPHSFDTEEEADKIAYFMNIAFEEGRLDFQRELKTLLGL